MAVPMASFATAVTFGSFTRRAASFCVAGVALCDIPTCFITRQKSFCVAGAILLRRCQKMRCIFPGMGRPKLRKAPQHPHAQRLGSNPWQGAFSPRIDLSKCEGGTKDIISLYHDYEFRVQPTNRWAVLACHWVLVAFRACPKTNSSPKSCVCDHLSWPCSRLMICIWMNLVISSGIIMNIIYVYLYIYTYIQLYST